MAYKSDVWFAPTLSPKSHSAQKRGTATDGYRNADIEPVVSVRLKLVFHAGEELTNDHLLSAIPNVRPLSKTDPQRVAAMAAWLERHAKGANYADCKA